MPDVALNGSQQLASVFQEIHKELEGPLLALSEEEGKPASSVYAARNILDEVMKSFEECKEIVLERLEASTQRAVESCEQPQQFPEDGRLTIESDQKIRTDLRKKDFYEGLMRIAAFVNADRRLVAYHDTRIRQAKEELDNAMHDHAEAVAGWMGERDNFFTRYISALENEIEYQ